MLQLLTPPAAEPLNIAAVRDHLKVDDTAQDASIALYLQAARAFAEENTHRQLIAARYRYTLPSFPDHRFRRGFIRLPIAPLINIESIQYRDPSGTTQTLDSAAYSVTQAWEYAHIHLADGYAWPIVSCYPNAVWIDFSAGHCAPFTADATADTITVTGWPTLAVNDEVRLSNSGGALPAPLDAQRRYLIKEVVSAGVYKLGLATGGDAINLTSTGTGTHYIGECRAGGGVIPATIAAWMLIRAETHFSHRGEHAHTKGNLKALPYVDNLLASSRLPSL